MSYAEKLMEQNIDNHKKFTEFKKAADKSAAEERERRTLLRSQRDRNGEGRALLRFLPPAHGELAPFIQYYSHYITVQGRRYWEKCPTTFGFDHPCPACDYVRPLWDGSEKDKQIASQMNRKTNYVANIYLISDSIEPKNEGRVFRFRYGRQVHDKLMSVMQPYDDDEIPIDPFDLSAEGANFELISIEDRATRIPSYENSKFLERAALECDEKEVARILSEIHPLEELREKSRFKSYEELSERFERVTGIRVEPPQRAEQEEEELLDVDEVDFSMIFDDED